LIKIHIEKNKGKRIKGQAKGLKILSEFRNLLKRNRIRDASRSIMFTSMSTSTITLALNKQAAYAGHISFITNPNESPLGPILIFIKSLNPEELIDWLVQPKRQKKLNDDSYSTDS
jgi:predicted RNA binding protein with dsRBD fold (UPF0201 family)